MDARGSCELCVHLVPPTYATITHQDHESHSFIFMIRYDVAVAEA